MRSRQAVDFISLVLNELLFAVHLSFFSRALIIVIMLSFALTCCRPYFIRIRVIIFGLWFSFDFFWVANTKFECIELYSAPDGSNIVNGKCKSGGNWQIQQCTYDSGICNIMPNLYHLLPYRMKLYTKSNLNNLGKNGQFNKLVPAGYMLIAIMPESSAKLMEL